MSENVHWQNYSYNTQFIVLLALQNYHNIILSVRVHGGNNTPEYHLTPQLLTY